MRRLVDADEPGEVRAGPIPQRVVDDQVTARGVAKVILQRLEIDVLATMRRRDAEQISLTAAALEHDLKVVARHARAHRDIQRPQRGIWPELRALRGKTPRLVVPAL